VGQVRALVSIGICAIPYLPYLPYPPQTNRAPALGVTTNGSTEWPVELA
jgi:hypothetical protein